MEQLDRLREGSRKLVADYENAAQDRDAAAGAQEALYRRSEELGERMQECERTLERIRAELAQMDEVSGELESSVACLLYTSRCV